VPFEIGGPRGFEGLTATPVKIPHDADPTVAYRIEHEGRVAVILTDMGYPHPQAARALLGAHLVLLEFNHDLGMLRNGPYGPELQKRVAGNGGHLSNEQAADFLRRIAGPELHTVVLAHLSEKNNTPELAHAAARGALDGLGLAHVKIVIAEQDEIGPNLAV
jgi:phosphoribosyl 1,2-cyclic phosphodiesterase